LGVVFLAIKEGRMTLVLPSSNLKFTNLLWQQQYLGIGHDSAQQALASLMA